MSTEAAIRLVQRLRNGESKESQLLHLMQTSNDMDYYSVMNAFWEGRGGSFEDAALQRIPYPDPRLRQFYTVASYLACIKEGHAILYDWGVYSARIPFAMWEDETPGERASATIEGILRTIDVNMEAHEFVAHYGSEVYPFSRNNKWWVPVVLRNLNAPAFDVIFKDEELDTFGAELVYEVLTLGVMKDKHVALGEVLQSGMLPRLSEALRVFEFDIKDIEDMWDASGSMLDLQQLVDIYAEDEEVDLEGFRVPSNLRYSIQEPAVTDIIERLNQ